MSGRRSFRVSDAAAANEVTELFNAFHDGFISRLTVVSHDSFPEVGVHDVKGPLDLEIEFAHYNYDAGAPPANRCIRAKFERVVNLQVQFTGAAADWPITSFELDAEGAGPGLSATLVQPRWNGVEWSHAKALSFGFARADFEELADS